MKVYVKEQGVTVVGKAWEVKYILQKYSRQFETVKDWIENRPMQ